MGEAADDDEVRQRIRDAILKAGGVPQTAARTGIPAKTLENYLAKRSTPSLDRAAKIAAAAGMRVGELAGEPLAVELSKAPIARTDLLERLAQVAVSVHKDVGITLPGNRATMVAGTLYNELAAKVPDLSDDELIEATLPQLRLELSRKLKDLKPGTGKRSVS